MRKKFLKALLVISCVFSVCIQNVCSAQEVELGKIEVKGKEEIRPYSYYVVSEDEIVKENARDTGELLKKVPGIAVRRTGLWGLEPSLRGLKEDQVNLLIDGVKVFGACPGRMDPPSSQLGAGNLEAVEVIKGPFSVRHGAGTLGGVINLISKKPVPYETSQIHGKLRLGFDDVSNGKGGMFDIYGGDKPYDYFFSVGGRKFFDYETPETEVRAGFKDVGYMAKVGLNPGNKQRLDLSVSQNRRGDVYHPARSMDSQSLRNLLTSVKYARQDISPLLASFSGRLYYNSAQHVMNNNERQSFNAMAMETEAESATIGGKMETVLTPAKGGTLISGIDFYRLKRDADRTRIMKGMMPMTKLDKPWDNARISDWGVYCEYTSPKKSNWDLRAGARVDLVRTDSNVPDQAFLTRVKGVSMSQRETNFSGNFGATWSIDEHFKLSAAVGRGVRTADASERYSNIFPSSKYFDSYDYLGDPALEPEKSLEFDLGAQAEFNMFSLKISLFYNQVQDYISARVDPALNPKTSGAKGVKRYVNVDAVLTGFEVEGTLRINREISLNADLSYTEGENKDVNGDLPQIAPLEANLGLLYDAGYAWGEVSGRFVDKQNDIDPAFGENMTSGFSTFGVKTGFVLFENYSVILGVENVFDKKYSEHLNGTNLSTGNKLLEPGRNLFAKLEWEF